MKIELETKISNDDLEEIKRRAFIAMEQMFLEGISVGRDLGTTDLHYEAEKLIYKQINELTNYFVGDRIWEDNIPSPKQEENTDGTLSETSPNEPEPDWNTERPFN